jgi:hypothetical protein
LLNRQRRAAEQDLDLSTKQVAHHSPAAAIRHVNHLDPGQHLDWTTEAIEERRWLRSLVQAFAKTGTDR